MKTYKAGIIGCGGIAESHFKGLKETGKAEIVSGWDIDPEAVKKYQENWDVKSVESAEALIDSDVDIVVIATPGFAHRDYVEKAATAGKHIICEKPVALNMEDAMAIKQAVENHNIIFQVSFNHRNTPMFVTLKECQDSGCLKGTVSAWARLHAPASSERWLDIQKSGHWRSSVELSGGRINEFCSHTVNWLLWVLGTPKTVYGRALYVTEGFEVDDADYALIECENGVGLLEVNRHAGVAPEENFGIMGHGGSVVLKDKKVLYKPMDKDVEEIPIDEKTMSKHAEFIDCIEQNKQPKTDVDSAIETLKVCLAFNKSAASGQVEKV